MWQQANTNAGKTADNLYSIGQQRREQILPVFHSTEMALPNFDLGFEDELDDDLGEECSEEATAKAAENFCDFLTSNELNQLSDFSVNQTTTAVLSNGERIQRVQENHFSTSASAPASAPASASACVSANSRFKSVTDKDLDQIREDRVPENTKKATKQWMIVFKEWCTARKCVCDLRTVSASRLGSLLKFAYVEIRQQNGEVYAKSSILSFRSAIQRELSLLKRPMNVFTDKEFEEANHVLDGFLKKLKRDGNTAAVQHKQPISESDMAKLNEYFSNWEHDAIVLTQFVWFLVTYHFCLRGSEVQAYLTRDDLQVCSDDNCSEYIRLATAYVTKNHQGGTSGSDPVSDGRIIRKCHVQAVQLLLSKLNGKSPRVFQIARKHYKVDDREWYTGQVIGKNTIDKMMKTLSERASLSVTYTNHCVRASTITNLQSKGASATAIMRTSGHKSVQSLSHYLQPTEADKLQTARLLDSDEVADGATATTDDDIDQFLSLATQEQLAELEKPQPPTMSVTSSGNVTLSGNFHGNVQIVMK